MFLFFFLFSELIALIVAPFLVHVQQCIKFLRGIGFLYKHEEPKNKDTR